MKQDHSYTPSPEIRSRWPEMSGNAVNGLDEESFRQPKPVFWRTDESIAHLEVLRYFYDRYRGNELIRNTRKLYDEMRDIAEAEQAAQPSPAPAEGWSAAVKQAALKIGADLVGICVYDPAWTFNDRPQPKGKWAVVMGFAHDYAQLAAAPHEDAYVEVMMQYARAGGTAKRVTNWIRERGYAAEAKTGPMTEDVLMIPAAIAAGLGELGKHGSIINRKFGANFRLSMVTTDLPLEPDGPDVFGADDFCANCQVCANACPPDAIYREKQVVNGERKWYVDFDKCLPYFIENETCGLCLAVCPWSRPGIADNLVKKMARRRAEKS